MNSYSMIVIRGHKLVQARTGRELYSEITAWEQCDRANNVRRYVVSEQLGFETVRREVIDCPGYAGTAESPFGKLEAARAFALAREWAKSPPSERLSATPKIGGR